MNYVERMIVTKVAAALCAKKPCRPITVCGERGYDPDAKCFTNVEDIVKEANQFDEVHLFYGGTYEQGYGPWVFLIFGNGNGGWDVISDYMTSLEETLKPVLDFIEKEGD